MLTLEECKKMLSTDSTFSEDEVEELVRELYTTANLAFDAYWLNSDSGSNNPLGSFEFSGPDTSI